jgi:hypothetical protein
MQRKVSVFITSDPFISHKPVEALRIATGLTDSDIEVTIVCPKAIREIIINSAEIIDENIRDGIKELIKSLRFTEYQPEGEIKLYF